MMRLREWQWVLVGAVLLVTLLIYLVLRLPLSVFFADEMRLYGITDLQGSSLGKGNLWFGQSQLPGVSSIEYSWCPMRGIATWCVDIDGDMASFDAVVTPRPAEVYVADANVRKISPDLFGPMGSVLDGNLRGSIQSMRITSFECPLQNLDELSAQLHINGLSLMGAPMGDHQVVARKAGSAIEVVISGDSLDGTFNLESGAYDASGRLLANAQIEAMARSFMRPLGANRYGWEINGSIPC